MRRDRPKFHVAPTTCISLALAVILLPMDWVISWLVAALLHEACHVITVRSCGARIHSIEFSPHGAVMITDSLTAGQQILCALAGPVGGLLLLFISRLCPQLAICGCVQSAYNLLPLADLDGGKVLQGILYFALGENKALSVSTRIDRAIRVLLCILGVYAAWKLSWGILAIICIVRLFRRMKIKFPCKHAAQGVQYR